MHGVLEHGHVSMRDVAHECGTLEALAPPREMAPVPPLCVTKRHPSGSGLGESPRLRRTVPMAPMLDHLRALRHMSRCLADRRPAACDLGGLRGGRSQQVNSSLATLDVAHAPEAALGEPSEVCDAQTEVDRVGANLTEDGLHPTNIGRGRTRMGPQWDRHWPKSGKSRPEFGPVWSDSV